MRPATTKFARPKLMRAPKLPGRRLQHRPRQRAAFEMLPQTLARQFFCYNGPRAGDEGAVAIPIEHLKAARLPTLPLFNLAPKANRNVRHAKIEISPNPPTNEYCAA